MNHPIRTRLGVFIAVAALLCSAAVSSGQETIARYTLNTDNNSTVTSTLATVSTFTYGSGGGARTTSAAGVGLDGQTGSHAKANGSNAIVESLANAITINQYVGFTITPTESLNILSLTFDFAVVNNTTTVDPYVGTWALFTSATGFTSEDLLRTGFVSTPKSSGSVASWNTVSLNLATESSLQSAAISPLEFRLYFWDNSTTASSTNLSIRFDDVRLTAASAIPEPSTYAAMFGAAALGLALWRRRVRHA